jgi:PAS domain S-box-containing protein
MSEARARPHTKLLLGRRMTLVVAGIAALLATSYLIAGMWFARIQLEHEFNENAELIGATLVSSLMEAVLTQNVYKIPDLLEDAQKANHNLRYAFVCDSEGNPVAYSHAFKSGVPGDLERIAQGYARNKKGIQSEILRTENGDIYHLIFPIQGNPGGALHLGFSMAQLDNKLHDAAGRFIGSMLMGLLLSVMVGGLVYRWMAQPISQLINVAENFGSGDFSSRVLVNSRENDEVTLLALALNRMADQLQEKLNELEHSRELLADEKTRIQAILDDMLHGVVFYQPDGRIGYWNPAAREHWGWSRNEIPDSAEAFHGDYLEAAETIRDVFSGKEKSRQAQIQRGDRVLDLLVSGIHRGSGELLGVVEITADITAQVNSNRALAHAEKLNVVGQLAAGVAHEINSPLDGAIEAARILEKAELPADEQRELARVQRGALERIAAIVYRLLTFSRKDQALKKPLPVWYVINEAVEMIRYRLARKNLRLEMPDGRAVPFVIEGEALELSQVMVNLLNNAIDASPNGGEISIEVSNAPGWITISVVDQGAGVSEELRARIFTPFFTTKEVGKGTGLGLIVSRNIIEQYGGRITFENKSRPWGASFSVHIPWQGSNMEDELKAEPGPEAPSKQVTEAKT